MLFIYICKRWLGLRNNRLSSWYSKAPKVTDSPLPMQPELLKMQTYPVARLRTIAESQVSQAKQERHLELLQKNSDGAITPVERVELVTLREQADQLMLRKAYAWALLRWRGYPVPALDDIAVN
jgi:hypothetical protein